MDTDKATFSGYAILELMGHRRLGGYVRETTFAGAAVARIDIPKPDAPCWKTADAPSVDEVAVTQMYGGSAIFCLTPCKASVARAVAVNARPVEMTFYEQQTLAADRQLPGAQPPVEGEIVGEEHPEDRHAEPSHEFSGRFA